MNQVRDFSDKRISSRCCFCGGDGSTGDHVPSKAFFDEPFPENLMIVRCCKECNSSFSADEEYAACVIEVARCGSLDVEREKVKRMLAHNQTGCAGVLLSAEAIRTSVSARVNDSKIEKIMRKLWQYHHFTLKITHPHASKESCKPSGNLPHNLLDF